MKEEKQIRCEVCGKKNAVIHVQQIMGSEVIEFHLCEDCAEKKGITSGNKSLELSISELLTGLLNITNDVKSEKEKEKCDFCGTTYKSFQKEGKIGCSECVQVFRNEISVILDNIAGTHQHKGKYPQKLKEYKKLLIDKADIQAKLSEAVKNEDYEAAAVLRDKLYEIERSSGE